MIKRLVLSITILLLIVGCSSPSKSVNLTWGHYQVIGIDNNEYSYKIPLTNLSKETTKNVQVYMKSKPMYPSAILKIGEFVPINDNKEVRPINILPGETVEFSIDKVSKGSSVRVTWFENSSKKALQINLNEIDENKNS